MTKQQYPIGVFDSGVGGLTIVQAVRKLMPNESLIYFGDTAHLPYGDKSADVLKEYAAKIARFLVSQEVKAIIIACNTASAVAFDVVQQEAGAIPVFEVITPAVADALKHSASSAPRIGIIGTKTTVNSHVYLRKILDRAPNAFVVEKATPLLVPLIEEGWLNLELFPMVIQAYMSDTGFRHIETLILGCTHYPLIAEHIHRYFAHNQELPVRVINSSEATARQVQEMLSEKALLNDGERRFPDRYYVSDFTPNFQEIAERFIGTKIELAKLSL